MKAEQWNALHPVGTPVFAYPGCRPEDDTNDERLVTRTRSKASIFGGVAVVMVDGYERIALTHVDVVTEDEWEAAKTADAVAAQGALPMPVGPEVPDGDVDADTVAARAAQVISNMGAELRAARAERDRYRLAWQSARERAQAYGEGILRVVKDRESYQLWLKQAEARIAELEAASNPQHFGYCDTNVEGHLLVNEHCRYCGKSAQEAAS